MVNIHRISHYLNWDFPPHYRAQYNILIFCHAAKDITWWRLTDKILYDMSNLGFRGTDMFLWVFDFLNETERRELALQCIPHNIYEEITKEKRFTRSTWYRTITVSTTEEVELFYRIIKHQRWDMTPEVRKYIDSRCMGISAFLVHVTGKSIHKQVFYTEWTNPFETYDVISATRYVEVNDLKLSPTRSYEWVCRRAHCETNWKVLTTVTKDSRWNITHLHTKFLNPMNYYNASVILNSSAIAELKKNERTEAKIVLIPLTTMFAASEENVKAQLTRKLDESVNVDDVEFLISPIFE